MTPLNIEKAKTLKPLPPAKELGFGKYFSDHMAVVKYGKNEKGELSWGTPKVIPYGPLSLDPAASVLHYGQELFEGLKAYRGKDDVIRLFRPEMNWERLCDGATRLCMQAPSKEDFIEMLKVFVRLEDRWVPSEPGCAFYLRPTLIGTEAFLGVRPSQEYLFYVIGSPVGSYYGSGSETVRIKVETEFVRAAPGGVGFTKTGGNYAASLSAAKAAKAEGFAQVLWLDATHKKYIEEVGTMNVFFKIGGKILTPPLDGTILPGVTRDSVLQLLKDMGTPAEEREISLEEILKASESEKLEEVFGSGTAASISPVDSLGVNGKLITVGNGKTGPVAHELLNQLTSIQYGRTKDKYGWTIPLN